MKEITLEQIILAGIIYLESVDKEDLKLLIKELEQHGFYLSNKKESIILLDYVNYEDNKYVLKSIFTLKTQINEGYTIKDEFENIATTDVLNVISNLDMDLFTLKKLKRTNLSKVKDMRKHFGLTEMTCIENLLREGDLIKVWEGFAIYDEEQCFKITQKGEVKIFIDENKEEVESLTNAFQALGYDISLIPEFLMAKNLDTFYFTAETMPEFETFCSIYDRP